MNPMLIPMWLMTIAVGNVALVLAMFVPPEETERKEKEGTLILPFKLKAQPS